MIVTRCHLLPPTSAYLPHGRYVTKGELPELSAKLKNGQPENKKEVEILKAKLPIVKQKGEELKGANKKKQLSFFLTSGDENNDLEMDILEAILSDCDTTEDAIMHAVKWSEPEIIDTQLQISRQIDAEGLVRAFQSALLVGTHNDQCVGRSPTRAPRRASLTTLHHQVSLTIINHQTSLPNLSSILT